VGSTGYRNPPSGLFILGVVAVLAAAVTLAGRSLEIPGLYYDEAVQARPALEFATGEVRATALPGSQVTWLGNRPLPLMTQPYMGALKSQLLAGPLWLFGPDLRVLRAVTLGIALLGIAVLAFWARRVFGELTAWLGTVLLAFDPTILLLARHDWGSFSISLFLRGVVLLAGWRYWETRKPAALWLAAFALGLGFYNKIDFVIFVAGAGIALALCAGREVIGLLRERVGAFAGAALAFVVGLGPLLLHVRTVISHSTAFGYEGEASEKMQTIWTLLDGSHFYRLMEHGGLFERLGGVQNAPSGPFVIAFLFAAGFIVFRWATSRSEGATAIRLGVFLLLANAIAIAAFAALPGAVRIHHALNLVPFPHFLVAFVLADLSTLGTDATRRIVPRFGIGLVVIVLVALQVAVYEQTRSEFSETGGRGRWSSATSLLALELQDTSTRVISLDWGFHEPLAFLGAGESLEEVHWRISNARRRSGAWRSLGDADDLYVLHLPPYDLSGYGESFLEAARAVDADSSEIRSYTDGRGEVAFVTVRLLGHHAVVFDGNFTIRLGH